MIKKSARLAQLSELIFQTGKLCVWAFTASGELLNTNCPYKDRLIQIFPVQRYASKMLNMLSDYTTPCVVGNRLGLCWAVISVEPDFSDPQAPYVLLIGPVCFDRISVEDARLFLTEIVPEGTTAADIEKMTSTILSCVPVTNTVAFNQEILKFHYLANDATQEVHIAYRLSRPGADLLVGNLQDSIHSFYANEQVLLNIVRSGDLSYRTQHPQILQQCVSILINNKLSQERCTKSFIAFLVLISHAAIDGGLSPLESFQLTDRYVPLFEKASDGNELMDLCLTAFEQYVSKVHEIKSNPAYSSLVQHTVNYIKQHLGQKILAADIAEFLGYNEYYLTKRFKEETGIYINEYIKTEKIKKAQQILATTDMKIQEVSELLGFSTCNYFCTCFRHIVGKSPQEFRLSNENKHYSKIGN